MSTQTVEDVVALIATGWERAAHGYRADAAHHRSNGDTIAAAICDAEAAATLRHARQLRESVPVP